MSNLRFPDTLAGLEISVQREADYDVKTQWSLSRKRLDYTYETYPLTKYKVGFEVLRSDSSLSNRARELQNALTHIARHYGQLDSFLLIDPADSSVTDHGFAVGDGTTTAFQLQRTLQGDILDAYGQWPASSKPRTNLCIRSQQLDDAAWNKSFGGTGSAPVVVPDAGVAPDGTPTADFVYMDRGAGTTSADFSMLVSTAIAATVPTSYVFSVWLRSADGQTYTVVLKFGTLTTTFITVGPTWQRFSTTAVSAAGANLNGRVRLAGDQTQQTANLFVWGAQIEVGATPTQYIPTTSAAVTVNPSYWPGYADGIEPIFDLNGPATFTVEADGLGKRPLVQWSRTNLALQSAAFDNASWVQSGNVSVTANATAAPDGTTTADKLIESTTTSAEHYVGQTIAIAANLPMANVVYAKAAERTWLFLALVLRDATNVPGAYFDLTNGVVGTITSGGGVTPTAKITACGNGWYRCEIVSSVGAGGSNPQIRIQMASADNTKVYAGTVNSGLFLWGGQAEQAFAAGDYIPTTTATVSRTDITVSSTAGVTAAVAPRTGAVLAWSASYFRRVRFAQQSLPVEQIVQTMWAAKSLALVSVKP